MQIPTNIAKFWRDHAGKFYNFPEKFKTLIKNMIYGNLIRKMLKRSHETGEIPSLKQNSSLKLNSWIWKLSIKPFRSYVKNPKVQGNVRPLSKNLKILLIILRLPPYFVTFFGNIGWNYSSFFRNHSKNLTRQFSHKHKYSIKNKANRSKHAW